MTLDYEAIRKMTKEKNVVKTKEEPLTDKELKRVQYYIEDIEYNVLGLAESGKDKFSYDCSKLAPKIFKEVVNQFKSKNPLFYVTSNSVTQLMTVEWHGKNEA